MIKNIVKLFIPPIIIKIWVCISDFVFHQKLSKKFISTVADIQRKSDKLIILGNGPSLNDSINELKEQIVENDFIVVNMFCLTDYYVELKPKFYLLADYLYFVDISNFADFEKKFVLDVTESIVNKTQWDMNLIVPSKAVGSWFLAKTQTNPNIHVYFYNMLYLDNPLSLESKFKAWDENLIAPPNQTVLNTCVWLGVFLRYKEIFLIGADSTFMQDIRVDQETNLLYLIDSHFYGEIKRPIYTDADGTIPQKLHVELNSISVMLSNYWDLKYYADYAGVKIYNASKYSLIDAYERRKRIN